MATSGSIHEAEHIYLEKIKILLSSWLFGNIRLSSNQQRQLRKILYNPKYGEMAVEWANASYGYKMTVISML